MQQPTAVSVAQRRYPPTTIVYAMIGACGASVTGGIATASRNNLRALARLASERDLGLRVLSLLEEDSDRPPFLPPDVSFEAFEGRKARFAVRLLSLSLLRPLFVFDHVSIALPVLPIARMGLARTAIFCHGSESWKKLTTLNRWSFQSASLCLANSHYTIRRMTEAFSGFQGRACPLGLAPEIPVNSDPPEPSEAVPALVDSFGSTREVGRHAFVLVGRMLSQERGKGHRQLIRALPRVLEDVKDAQLVFIGPGDDIRHLREMAQQERVGERVLIPGRVDAGALRAVYRHAFAFAMPSRQEGFGLAYLEAMNEAKPCIGCFDDGGEDVIVHEETGLLVGDPNDSEELASVMLRLLKDPEAARKMGEAGLRRLREEFTAAHAQARVREHIAALL